MSFLVNRVALNSFENQGGTLHGYVYGDKYPRVFKNLRVVRKPLRENEINLSSNDYLFLDLFCRKQSLEMGTIT